jgi:uncharacterized membrane protein
MLNEPAETKEEKRMRQNMREMMRKAGGILTIIGGTIIVVGLIIATGGPWALIPELTAPPPAVVVGVLIAVAVVAVIGGIYALRGRRWGLALAGACCAAFPLTPVGILASIFISITKREFE